MDSMKALLCTLILAASFGYGTCQRCLNDYDCKYGWCCNWECCASYNYYVYLGVGVTFGVVTIVGVVVVVVCLLKKSTRSGRVIATTPPAPGQALNSHTTATSTSEQIQSRPFAHPPPQGYSGDDSTNSLGGTIVKPPEYSRYPPA